MQITEKAGTAINAERLEKTSRDLAAAARDFTKALGQIAEAVVEVMNAVDWSPLSTALAAAGYGAPKAEPDKNPVRFIGIRKGGWKRGRGTRHEHRKIIRTS